MSSAAPRFSHRRDDSRGSNETIRAGSTTGTQRHGFARWSKTCSVWVHDENYSKEDVLLDLDILGKDVLKPGDLVEVTAAISQSETYDFQTRSEQASRGNTTATGVLDAVGQGRARTERPWNPRQSTNTEDQDDLSPDGPHSKNSYVFVAKFIPSDVKSRAAGVQISLKSTIANAFGFRNGDQVTVSFADRHDHAASHVELVFRDIYLSRADMWRLLVSELCGKTLYKGQKILFLGTIKATVKTIYAHGTKVASSYFSKNTIPIYRSESARYVIFIQMSREMWNFDSEGTGEILFSRVIDGFLPDLFKRWQNLDAKHLVTIVMFARLEYDYHQLVSLGQLHSAELKQSQFDSGRTKYRDFYRVVLSDMSSGQWTLILNALKKEFRVFLRDISIQEASYLQTSTANTYNTAFTGKPRIAGRPSLALRGNILEAINIASSHFGRDFIDRDLVRTGISVVIVTPGPGIFEVDRDLLHLTSETYLDHGESPQSARKGAKALVAAHNRSHKHKLERMDEYDRQVFQTKAYRKRANSRAKLTVKSTEKRAPAKSRPEVHDFPSNNIITPVKGHLNTAQDQSATKEKKPPGIEPKMRPKMAPVQKASGSRIARSISFALRGLGTVPPRALASTSINVENVSGAGISKGDSSSRGFSGTASIKSPGSQRHRAIDRMSVDSERSDQSDSSRSILERSQSPSRPISIKQSTRNLGHKHRPSDEDRRSFSTPAAKVEDDQDQGEATPNRHSMDSRDSGTHTPEPDRPELVPQPPLRDNVSPWVKNVNPSNPKKSDPNATLSLGRWQHVFPRTPRASTIKWRSLCTPASVPLTTEIFPTRYELEAEFVQTPYTIHQESDSELLEVPKTRETLVSEMISLRLSHGYQVIVGAGVADTMGIEPWSASQICDINKLVQDGNVLVMSMGNTIQKLSFSDEKDIHVTKYVRKQDPGKRTTHIDYVPVIRSILSPTYVPRHLKIGGYSEEYPWSHADAYLAGQKGWQPAIAEQLRFWRARFVLIPVDPPNAKRGMQIMGHDTPEEIHLTGIKILSQMWQKFRYVPVEDRVVKLAVGKRKDPNPLDIMFQTRNPSEVVAGELDRLLEAEENTDSGPLQLLPESELFQLDSFTVAAIAQAMQSERGVEIVTRRWHLRLHYNCFTGTDFTTWLLQNFKDVETREEAAELGNELMRQKLFYHVEQRHHFRDGNYFYQIAPEYRLNRPEARSSWFSGKRTDRSVPVTPMAECVSRDAPPGIRSQSDSSVNSESISRDSHSTPSTKPIKPRHSISLSKVMRVNVDFRNRSSRPEIIDLHYDRLHNPENCYHIELSWFNVTSKLVEDAIVQWATTGEKYGLRLVEIPIDEISSISLREPFRSPYHVHLSVPAPDLQPAPTYFNATSLAPQQGMPDKFYYQKQILKKFNFVLDLEAASNYPADVDVTFSWGKLDYQHSQYIHRSGIAICQIAEDGHFILLANRLYNTRSAYSKDTIKTEGVTRHDAQHFQRRPPMSQHATQHITATLGNTSIVAGASPTPIPNPLSPHPSPLVRATTTETRPSSDVLGGRDRLSPAAQQSTSIIPEDIKEELEALCSDPFALEKFYASVTLPGQAAAVSSSTSTTGRDSGKLAPRATPKIPEEKPDIEGGLEASIPSLVLPASVVGDSMAPKQQQRK
ncbi:putative vacuolar membrane-associated protein iml1 [Phaeomoniella chlamydospora]|uniref:Vacuolar membrane-associated protein IML1 n=1 Tax=Phaeomoniella chlamydospora TaxID=158046 RepID=A0A0G2DU20_PHACM|nr:putative vacuolar membrane-associated protein iml1 [Phaeomoniella chlamydospora]